MKAIFVFATLLSVGFTLPVKRTLDDDLQDFVDLVPKEKLQKIVDYHLANNEEFKAVIKYLNGSEWAALVQEVAAKQKVKDFKKYLVEAGINVDKIIAYISDWFNNVNVHARSASPRRLIQLIDEITAVLPIKEIVNLFGNKQKSSIGFQKFYTKVSSTNARALVEEVRALPEVQRLVARLSELGVDINQPLDFIYGLLKWE